MGVLLAILTGAALGYVLERGDFCFHSTLRGLVKVPRQPDLFRAYLVTLLVATPLVNGMISLGWIKPWIPPFTWQANVIGGLIFGIGMVVAATCITGLFYKLGHGMLGTLAGLVAWAAGDILTYRGPLSTVREGLSKSAIDVEGQSATLINLPGFPGISLVIGLGLIAIVYLWRAPRNRREQRWGWLPLGLAVGLVTGIAWLAAGSTGANYTFGTSSVPANIYGALTEGGLSGQVQALPLLWIPVTLASVVPGAFIAAWSSGTLWIRGETARRYLELAAGGFLMGVGAGIAGGCNLGHSLAGVPLLSLGSITTTLSMAVGVFAADRALKWAGTRRPGVGTRPTPTVERCEL